MKKILVFISITIVLSALAGCSKEETVREEVIKQVKTMQVDSINQLTVIKYPGTVRASKRAELSFDVPGRIVKLNAQEGATIKKGTIIAQLDDSDYQNNYQSAKANLKEAKLTFDRYQKLFKQKVIAKANLDKAEKAYDIAQANMKVAKKAFSNTKLKAYFSGTIAARYVENFQNIQAKQLIISIEDTSVLEIVVHVPEIALATTKEEDIISKFAAFDVIPDTKFALDLKEISTKADPATRTYAVVLSMPAPKRYNILSGMTADVIIEVSHHRNESDQEMILVPASAVMGDNDNNSYVWIYSAKTSTVSKREVIIGEMKGSNIHIKSGLQYKETIVTAGVNYLVDGMKVRLLTGKIGD